MGLAGAVLLIWRMKLADMVVAAAAPIGVVFCVVALLTGSIWGRPTWGTWWVWDARTTSMLVLLFLYFGVMALRQAVPREETAGRAAAILAVVGMVDIPIIKYSVDWWLTLHQTSTFKLTVGAVDAGRDVSAAARQRARLLCVLHRRAAVRRRQRSARARATHAVGRRSRAEPAAVSFATAGTTSVHGRPLSVRVERVWRSACSASASRWLRPLRARRRFFAEQAQRLRRNRVVERVATARAERSRCIPFGVIG